MALHKEIYHKLITTAANQRTVPYGQIAPLAGLDMSSPADRKSLGEILGEISSHEHDLNRPLLSVVATFSGSLEPSPGFYNLAASLGVYDKAKAKDEFFYIELTKAHEFWKTNKNNISSIIENGKIAASELTNTIYPEVVLPKDSILEGSKKTITVNGYERSVSARNKCIDYYGPSCSVCGMDFLKIYGKIGKGFIHVHHIIELSELQKEYEVDPILDLRPVCPNCHAMLHRKRPSYTVEELKRIIEDGDT